MENDRRPSYPDDGDRPLALILKARGKTVSGSDRALDQGRLAEKFDFLRASGIALFPQDGSGIAGPDTILVTSAAVSKRISADLVIALAGRLSPRVR